MGIKGNISRTNFSLLPNTIANLYKDRWKIELFFKWIKGASKN
ncbi:MAG: transposase [Ignavibacteriaceae bacterium]